MLSGSEIACAERTFATQHGQRGQLGDGQVIAELLVSQPSVQPVQREAQVGGQRCDVRHFVSVPHDLDRFPGFPTRSVAARKDGSGGLR